MEQKQYNDWVLTTNSFQQDYLCGGNHVSINELYFINKYAKENILDIGCGTGHRTFQEWEKRDISFYGLEKFVNLINSSNYREKIIQFDIIDTSFKELLDEIIVLFNTKANISIAFLFGGVINGLIEFEKREKAWENFKYLSERCNFILIDTLTHFNWYKTNDTGQTEKLFNIVPIQYFYSKKELDRLIDKNNLMIVEEKSENLGNLIRSHYLLRKKT